MRLYYTGATEAFAAQGNPLLSLGGYISSTPVENASVGNLFTSIGQNEMINGGTETRMIVLKNETAAVQNVTLYYSNLPDSVVYYKMSLVSPALDDCQKEFFEKLDTINSTPIQASFTDNRGGNEFTFQIAVGGYIGIWIQRVVVASKGKSKITCDYLNEKYVSINANVIDESGSTIGSQSTELKTTLEWTLNTVNNGSYFTFGDVLIGLVDNTVAVDFPQGYEVIRVPYLTTDTLAEIDVKIKSKIDSILVDRGEVTRNGNVLSSDQILPTPLFQDISVVFENGTVENNSEKMSMILEY